jgi:hypothetical protein
MTEWSNDGDPQITRRSSSSRGLTTGWTSNCAADRVDLLLVLAADISHSVDEVKFQLQRSGYAAAFSDSRVIEAIRSGSNGRIAVAFVEWSGPSSQRIVIDWMVISDDKTARLFGDHLVEASRAFANSTSISAGIDFAMTQIDRAPYETRRLSSTFRGMAITIAAVMSLRRGMKLSLEASRSTGLSS